MVVCERVAPEDASGQNCNASTHSHAAPKNAEKEPHRAQQAHKRRARALLYRESVVDDGVEHHSHGVVEHRFAENQHVEVGVRVELRKDREHGYGINGAHDGACTQAGWMRLSWAWQWRQVQ